MTLVMSMVIPKGAKMLEGFQKYISTTKDKQKLSKERSMAFIQAQEKTLQILGANYHISAKGVLTQYETSNDND
jgi:hypothetical protein